MGEGSRRLLILLILLMGVLMMFNGLSSLGWYYNFTAFLGDTHYSTIVSCLISVMMVGCSDGMYAFIGDRKHG